MDVNLMQTIFTATSITEAELIRGLLEQNGISAHINGQYLQGGIGVLPAVDLIGVSVADELVVDAKNIIEAYERATPDMGFEDTAGEDTGINPDGEAGQQNQAIKPPMVPMIGTILFCSLVIWLLYLLVG